MAFRRGLFARRRRRTSPSSRRRSRAWLSRRRPHLRRRHRRRLRRAGRGAAEVLLRRPRRDRRLRAARHRGRPQLRRPLLRPIPGAFAARLTGVATREEAEALKGTRLYAPRDRLPPLADDEFYHADLIGLAVVDTGGAPLGTVRAVLDHGAGDILEIARPGAPDLLLPFTRAAVPTVDLAARRIVADPPEACRSLMTAPWTARVLTLFPEMFPGPLGHSLLGRALARGPLAARGAQHPRRGDRPPPHGRRHARRAAAPAW